MAFKEYFHYQIQQLTSKCWSYSNPKTGVSVIRQMVVRWSQIRGCNNFYNHFGGRLVPCTLCVCVCVGGRRGASTTKHFKVFVVDILRLMLDTLFVVV